MSKFDRVLLKFFVSKPFYLALYSLALLIGTLIPLIRRWFWLRLPFWEGVIDYTLDVLPMALAFNAMAFAAHHLAVARQQSHPHR